MDRDIYKTFGGVTHHFNRLGPNAVHVMLAKYDIRVERYKVRAPGIDGFIASADVGKFRVLVNGIIEADNLEMPRDVWNVLYGIEIGLRLNKPIGD